MVRNTITAIFLVGVIGMFPNAARGTEPVTEPRYSVVIAPGTIDNLPLEERQDALVARGHIFNFMQAISNRDIATVESMISPYADPELMQHIRELIETTTVMEFHQIIHSVSAVHPERIEMKGPFSANGMTMSGVSWSVQGLSIRYTFENINGEWMISDTNIHERLGTGSFGQFFIFGLLIFVPFFLVLILATAFQIWMIIDAVKRPLENKALWLIIILIGGILGAILYFFIPRRKHKKLLAPSPEVDTITPPPAT